MLVLSRQRDESIMIGENVVITIVDIRGDKVRLGIEAPQEVPVHRQEVYEAIKRDGRRSNAGVERDGLIKSQASLPVSEG
jgi:carbon storage regulator